MGCGSVLPHTVTHSIVCVMSVCRVVVTRTLTVDGIDFLITSFKLDTRVCVTDTHLHSVIVRFCVYVCESVCLCVVRGLALTQ